MFHALRMVIAILFNSVFYFFAIIVNTCDAKYDFFTVSSDHGITPLAVLFIDLMWSAMLLNCSTYLDQVRLDR